MDIFWESASLNDRNRGGRILREPVRQNQASSASTDNDIVKSLA